jgi:hypothetical protein
MKKLKDYFLNNGYFMVHVFGENSFIVKRENGDWSKQVSVSHYSGKYEVKIIEGLPNLIKYSSGNFQRYKEVIEFV